MAIARHAIEQGFIPESALASISVEKKKDEAPPSPIEEMVGKAPQPEGSTVKVTSQSVKRDEVDKTLQEAGSEKTSAPPTVVVEDKNKKKNKNKD